MHKAPTIPAVQIEQRCGIEADQIKKRGSIAGGRLVGKSMSFDFGLMVPVAYGQIDYAVPWSGGDTPGGAVKVML